MIHRIGIKSQTAKKICQFKIEFFQCLSGDVNANFALPVRYARYTLLRNKNMARIFDFHAGGPGSIPGFGRMI